MMADKSLDQPNLKYGMALFQCAPQPDAFRQVSLSFKVSEDLDPSKLDRMHNTT